MASMASNVEVLYKCGDRGPDASCSMLRGHGGWHWTEAPVVVKTWPAAVVIRDGLPQCGYKGCARIPDHPGEHVSVATTFGGG